MTRGKGRRGMERRSPVLEWRLVARGLGSAASCRGDGGVVSLTPRRETEAGLATDVGAMVAGVLGLVVGAKKPTSRSPIL